MKLLAAVLLLALPHALLGCGMIFSHIENNERAAYYFNGSSDGVDFGKLIRENRDAYQPASTFPDTFYSEICFGANYYNASEDTHWSPFIKAAVNYFRRKYPAPWTDNKDAVKLAVYLFGIVGHQVADINWHSIGMTDGFLDTMSKRDYHGIFDTAHSDGDFGGDVLNGYELNMDHVGLVSKWYVPSADLVNIYADLYKSPNVLPRSILEGCSFIAYLLRLGEKLGLLDTLYTTWAAKTPFLIDNLNEYYLGGTDDMAVWIQNQWLEVIKMMTNGPQICNVDSNGDLPYNPVAINCNGKSQPAAPYDKPDIALTGETRQTGYHAGTAKLAADLYVSVTNFLFDNALTPKTAIITTVTDMGVTFTLVDSVVTLLKNTLTDTLNGVLIPLTGVKAPSYQYTTDNSYSRLGEFISTGDINNDGFADAVISAPGYSTNGHYQQGRVYIFYGTVNGIPKKNLLVENNANQTLSGSSTERNSRFGWTTLVMDVNGDGWNDLVVSAPSAGSRILQYFGMVLVYLSPGKEKPLPTEPSNTILCTVKYCNLGWSLAAGDVNKDGKDDLIIGAPFATVGVHPQRGMVGAFFSGPNFPAGTSTPSEKNFDWRFDGKKDYQWAGFSIGSKKTAGGTPWLVIGAPSHRISQNDDVYAPEDIQAVGKAFIFKLPSATPAYEFEGTKEFEQLGSFVNIDRWNNDDVVIVSSTAAGVAGVIPGIGDKKQVGVVNFYKINGNDEVEKTQPLLTLTGENEFSRFGASVVILNSSQGTSYAAVSAPFSSPIPTDHEGGRVHLYKRGLLKVAKVQTFGMTLGKTRFGSSLAVVRNGVQNQVQLLIGVKHYSINKGDLLQPNVTRLAGAVGICDLNL
jgi:glycosylphosphatidylinositol phospholipase D